MRLSAILILAAPAFCTSLSNPVSAAIDEGSGTANIEFCKQLLAANAAGISFRQGYCFGIVSAVGSFLKSRGDICPPPGAENILQALRIVVGFMERRPEVLHSSLLAISSAALKEAFPCR
jgi:hypothetical protein